MQILIVIHFNFWKVWFNSLLNALYLKKHPNMFVYSWTLVSLPKRTNTLFILKIRKKCLMRKKTKKLSMQEVPFLNGQIFCINSHSDKWLSDLWPQGQTRSNAHQWSYPVISQSTSARSVCLQASEDPGVTFTPWILIWESNIYQRRAVNERAGDLTCLLSASPLSVSPDSSFEVLIC